VHHTNIYFLNIYYLRQLIIYIGGDLIEKKLLFIAAIISLVLISSPIMAGKIKVNVNNKVKPGEKVTWEDINHDIMKKTEIDVNGFKGNFGPTIGLIRINLDNLNQLLESVEGLPFSPIEGKLITFGFKGIGGVIEGSRFGFAGLEGKSSSINNQIEGYREAKLKLNYGGFLYEKGVYYNSKTKTDLAFGALIGGGKINLDLYYNKTNGTFADNISTPSNNFLEKSFILLNPKLILHQQIDSFIGLDLSLGYLMTFDFNDNWKINKQIINGPLENFMAPTFDIKFAIGF
jgi:hypothetical protein